MQISTTTIEKINSLSEDKQKIVFSLVDQLAMTPLDVLSRLREQGLRSPMEMDEINTFINEAREQRC